MSPAEAAAWEKRIDGALAAGQVEEAGPLARQYQAAAAAAPSSGPVALAPSFRADYLAGQVALAAGELRHACRLLEPWLARVHELPDELAARLQLLVAEACARLGQHDRAEALLAGLAEQTVVRLPMLRLRRVRILLWLRNVTELGGELADCVRLLRQKADWPNLTLLRCEEGRGWERAGRLEQAEACWHDAEKLSQSAGIAYLRVDVLLQQGRLAHLRGHLQTALDLFEAAMASAPSPPQKLEITLRRYLVLLDLNQFSIVQNLWQKELTPRLQDLPEELEALARMVQALLGEEQSDGGSLELRAYQARRRGDVDKARQLYRQALAEASSPQRHARLALALGQLALSVCQIPDALSWLGQAEELARVHDLPEVLWRSLQARGQLVHEQSGDEESARRFYEEAMLIAEEQARQLRHGTDAAAYRLQRSSVLRLLLQGACRRGDADAAFRCQELDRGRLLLELWTQEGIAQSADWLPRFPDLDQLDQELARTDESMKTAPDEERLRLQRRQTEVLLQRDRLYEDLLRSRSRRGKAALPEIPDLPELQRALQPGEIYLAPSLVEGDVHLLAVPAKGKPQLVSAAGAAPLLESQMAGLRRCVDEQLTRYRLGFLGSRQSRQELDACLDGLGQGPLGKLLRQVLGPAAKTPARLLWIPDGLLHGLPLPALRLDGHYLIENYEVVSTFSGALLAHQTSQRRRSWRRWRTMVVTETPQVLPSAEREGQGVAAAFLGGKILAGPAATKAALRRWLPWCRVLHFACHGYFDTARPLAACIGLPSGESWKAVEWLDEPVKGLPLVTLSACRSAEVSQLVGQEVFGLVTGLLAGGVGSVLAGLWPVADRETLPLMWRFYRHLLTSDAAGALAAAQRESLALADSSPLFWSSFMLFGDSAALPSPGLLSRWWGRWRARLHGRRFQG